MDKLPVIAAIDIGSSAARLTIAEVQASGAFRCLFFHRYPVRLGTGAFADKGDGRVPPAVVDALLAAIGDMQRHMRAHNVEAVRAVATSAMREAHNGQDIAARATAQLGHPVDIIDGEQEADLSRRALVTAMAQAGEPLPEQSLLLDLGGGSLELATPSGHKRASLPVGSVRLLAAVPSLKQALSDNALASARAHIERVLHAAILASPFAARSAWQGVPMVGTGGNLEVMARLLAKEGASCGIDLGRAEQLIPQAARLCVAERQRQYQLRPERADLMLPALLIIALVGAAFGARFVRVPGSGLRDALLAELALKCRARSGL